VIAVHKRTFANIERLPFGLRWYAALIAKVGSNIWRIIRVMERLGMDDIVCDVLVVGSGASGFATALTARHLGLDVLIAEKEPVFGGTTCFSAGVVWIPSSSPARQAQIEDSEERALCYLRQEAGNHLNVTIASAYLANAPKMLDFFTANTHVRFDLLPTMPDYHAEFAGGVGGGRSLRPQVFDGRRLGKWFEKLRPPTKPGFIVVDKGGRRFANETASYHEFVPAMIEACRNQDELEAFIICDNRAIRRYGVGAVPPAPLRLTPFVDSGYIFRSSTIRHLARRAGINPDGLARTIDGYNPPGREGKDPEFGRGSDAFQRVHGAPHDRGPNPNVAPIEEAPFYALRIIPGDIGTFAGLKTDEFARVLNERNEVVPNLYAVGNDMASVMRGTYPGAGITIGPAMTFGYVAARHLAGQDAG